MTREEALAILDLPRAHAEAALLDLWEKAEQWERLPQASALSEKTEVTPTTPSGMTPVYLKPRAPRRRKRPGRKVGHAGAWRRAPARIDAKRTHRLSHCPECEGPVGPPIRTHRRLIEDLPAVTPAVTEHTVSSLQEDRHPQGDRRSAGCNARPTLPRLHGVVALRHRHERWQLCEER